MTQAGVPAVVIAGAAKCGTTSLHAWLGQHPEVAPSIVSEPGYFTGEAPQCRSIGEYEATFYPDRQPGTLTMEATPFNLFHPAAASLIHAASPSAKIVVSVRYPVDAVYSWYWHQRRRGEEDRPFPEVVADELRVAREQTDARPVSKSRDYLRRFDYPSQIERFVGLFGRENVFVLPFDSVRDDARGLLARVEGFLGLAPFDDYVFDVHNTASRARNQTLARIVRQVLRLLSRLPFRRVVPARLRALARSSIRGVAYTEFTPPAMGPKERSLLDDHFQASWARTQTYLDFTPPPP